jgi:hypothetical protein
MSIEDTYEAKIEAAYRKYDMDPEKLFYTVNMLTDKARGVPLERSTVRRTLLAISEIPTSVLSELSRKKRKTLSLLDIAGPCRSLFVEYKIFSTLLLNLVEKFRDASWASKDILSLTKADFESMWSDTRKANLTTCIGSNLLGQIATFQLAYKKTKRFSVVTEETEHGRQNLERFIQAGRWLSKAISGLVEFSIDPAYRAKIDALHAERRKGTHHQRKLRT